MSAFPSVLTAPGGIVVLLLAAASHAADHRGGRECPAASGTGGCPSLIARAMGGAARRTRRFAGPSSAGDADPDRSPSTPSWVGLTFN